MRERTRSGQRVMQSVRKLIQGSLRRQGAPALGRVAGKRPGPIPVLNLLQLKGPRQTCLPASRGPSAKDSRAVPAGFCGRDLVAQIWPPLTLSVSPVGKVCAAPRFRPNTCVFGLNLGAVTKIGRWSVGGEARVLEALRAGPRACRRSACHLHTRPRLDETT